MLSQSFLNKEDAELLKIIRDADQSTLMRGKDGEGIPFLKHIFRLHLQLFGETCEGCPGNIPGYIKRVQTFKNTPVMENTDKSPKHFRLNAGTIIPILGTSEVISEHNLTDAKAIELLAENPKRKTLFKNLPKNVDELIEAFKAENKSEKKSEAKAAKPTKPAAKKAEAPKAPADASKSEAPKADAPKVETKDDETKANETEVKGADVVETAKADTDNSGDTEKTEQKSAE